MVNQVFDDGSTLARRANAVLNKESIRISVCSHHDECVFIGMISILKAEGLERKPFFVGTLAHWLLAR